MDRKKILFVGENPYGKSGNSHMLLAILKQLNLNEYNPACFVKAVNDNDPWGIYDRLPIPIIPATLEGGDPLGPQRLLDYLVNIKLDALVFVGIDIWAYASSFGHIRQACDYKNIPWAAIFPYDLQHIRKDWLDWIGMVDYPYVYSWYGHEMLKDAIPGIQYFRPPHYMGNGFYPYDDEKKKEVRHRNLPTVRDDDIVFGFVGNNQVRKCPEIHMEAFLQMKNNPGFENVSMYFHTKTHGERNLLQLLHDRGFEKGWVHFNRQNIPFSAEEMRDIYNSLDCIVMCSMQEGLSWIPLEAMLCGVPVIASDTTAHPELLQDAGILVPCEEPTSVPLITQRGISWVDAKQCKAEDICDAMIRMMDPELRFQCKKKGLRVAREWLNNVSDINNMLDAITAPQRFEVVEKRKDAILFAQHSSAGDVLMTTRCLKPIKEKHPGKTLVYMTMPQFTDIVEGNPYIDEIIEWDDSHLQEYEVTYNPHGEKILPGGFNTLDVKLADMYPYFCRVKPDEFFIQEEVPLLKEIGFDIVMLSNMEPDGSDIFPVHEYIVVHNTGGHKYRIYKHMDISLKGLELPVVQIGGGGDYACQRADVDLRGKLTWRETAWVMKRAKAAICVDSFPMHLAGALGTPLVALFGPAPARVTGSIGDPEKIINLEPNWLDVCPHIGNCFGQQGCASPCINTISPMKVRQALLSFINQSQEENAA